MEKIENLKELYKKHQEEVESSENFLHYDFQGWPVYKKTLRELLDSIGAIEKDGVIGFKSDDDILDTYPMCGEDDGMAYFCNEMSFSFANVAENTEGNKMVLFWRDKKWEQKDNEE